MESNQYSPVLISQLMQEYRENIKKRYYEQMGFLEKSVNNIKNIYNDVYNNISNKINTPYTYENLDNEKDVNNKKIKEYGIIIGNFVTNIIVDSVDNYNIIRKATYNYIYPSKE
tara:strand:+ start:37 stop:378 length:342 start_codon:yes stop_codon:yes gene_type:complete